MEGWRAPNWSSLALKAHRSTSCTHDESIVAHLIWPDVSVAVSSSAASSGQGGKERAEAVGAEEGSVVVVDESGGDRIVEHRWPEGGQPTVAHRDGLPWVDEVDPVQR